jgi:hypothetical protein
MIKKLISLFVSICLLLSLTACVIKHNSDVEGTTATEILTEAITSELTETIATEETTGFVPSPEAPILDFHVTGFDLVEDYEGNPALIVFFVWTNGADDTTMFEIPYLMSAYQDGISLNNATIDYEHEYYELTQNIWREVRPGATLEIAKAFSLRSNNPIVEIECSNWLFSDEPLMLLTVDTSAKG